MEKVKKPVNKKKFTIIASALILAVVIGAGWTLAYFTDSESVTNNFTVAGNTGDDSGLNIDLNEPHYDPSAALDVYPASVIQKDPTITNTLDTAYARIILTLTETTDVLDADGNVIAHAGDPITDAARLSKIMTMLYYDSNYDPTVANAFTDPMPAVDKMTAAALESGKGGPVDANWIYSLNPEFQIDTTRGAFAAATDPTYAPNAFYFNYVGDGTAGGDILQHGDIRTLFTQVVVPSDWDHSDIDNPAHAAGDVGIGNFSITINAQAIQATNISGAAEAFQALDDGGAVQYTP